MQFCQAFTGAGLLEVKESEEKEGETQARQKQESQFAKVTAFSIIY